jgi:hypothetical protein
MMRRFSAWANRNPLLAVWVGFLAAFLIMCFVAPHLLAHAPFTTT